MNKIRFLTENEIKVIAAGEVIERPASIIKELVENSLDANSSFIKVEVFNGGKDFINIEDDGFGMEKEDLEKSIKPHATSKFFGVNDLAFGNINSYGFRGEALASIASISNLTISTRSNSSEDGYKLKVINGEKIFLEKSYKNIGTEIKIENIFDSIPVRKKFLKSKETEFNAISNVLIGMSLSSPKTRFFVFHNNKSIYQWISVENIFERIKQILPINLHEYILECDYKDDYLKVTGIISSIEYGNYDRSNIYVLVNKRLVKIYKLTQAIIKAYSADLLQYRYPFAYLSIEIDKNEIDINVHPRKEEIAFLHPKKVENSIINAIKKTLINKSKEMFSLLSNNDSFDKNIFNENKTEQDLNKKVEVNKEFFVERNFKEDEKENSFKGFFSENKLNGESFFERSLNNSLKKDGDINFFRNEKVIENKFFDNSEKVLDNKLSDLDLESKKKEFFFQEDLFLKEDSLSRKFMGIFSNTYLLFDLNEELLFIDQHALHERIIYEEIKNEKFSENFQNLLTPVFFKKDFETVNFVTENEASFKEAGLIVTTFDDNTIIIKSYSKFIDKIGFEEYFNILLLRLKENFSLNEIKEDFFRKIKGDIACKKAFRAGDKLNDFEISILIEKAFYYENVFLCPHGRPTFYKLSKKSIEKMFKRI